ncbi:hypothetical protein EDF56_103433 [Novosphingobium sp. PhB165]|uniref:Pycsar system effector family protein n=1 Tax=Novosphingobium sp. PhB165 TaxID=2485105 RepID=UPI001048D62B|nr:Pycsar system effector family protein [Novosphingobium sp. PhB165]TCM19790.1 hypothetical protein EDF56_103433 [Novosphingobium sp. PhB165]
MNDLTHDLAIAESVPRTVSVHSIHMVRTAMTNHMALSQMADQKANILMGTTFLVFTLSMREFDAGHYRYSLLILVCFAFVSALLAMGAVMPRTRAPKLEDERLDNLLFFGVFTALDQEVFVQRMLDRAATDEAVLTTMLRDIHQNGTVLQRQKYRFLGLAFQCLRAGLVLAMIAFLIENRQAFAAFLRLT